MLKTYLYLAEWEIDARLARFGVTRAELIDVVRQTLAARSDAIDVDPLNTPGQLSYIYGTRHLRLLFLKKGWQIDRTENVESVFDSKTGTKILFQNVDLACSRFQSPKAISGKGPAANRMIDTAQGKLFGPGDLPESVSPKAIASLNSTAWYFCVSFDEDGVKAELSLPASTKGGNFFGFVERIFVLIGGDWSRGLPKSEGEAPIEVLPTIARR